MIPSVPIPISVSFDAHDNEVDMKYDYLSMFENAQTNQVVDSNNPHDAITNVIERWGLGLKVEHQTHTQVAQLKAKAKFAKEQIMELQGQLLTMESWAEKVECEVVEL